MATNLRDVLQLVNGSVTVRGGDLSGLNAVFAAVFGQDPVVISSASLSFGAGDASADVEGSLPFLGASVTAKASFSVDTDGNVSVTFQLSGTISLERLMSEFLPSTPAPAALSIDSLALALQPSDSFSLTASMAQSPPWHLDVGFSGLTVSDVTLALTRTLPGSATGKFSGTIALGDAKITIDLDIPGEFEIQGQLPDISLLPLIDTLADQKIPLPSGFNIDFTDNAVLIKDQDQDLEFLLSTHVADFGLASFVAEKSDDTWGFAFGMDVPESGLAKLLSPLKAFEDFFKLEKLLVVISSLANPAFSFPDVSEFDDPNLGTGSISLPAQAGGLEAGFNFFAQLGLGGSQAFQTVSKFLHIPLDGSLGIILQVGEDPAQNAKLVIDVAETIQPGITVDGQFGGLLQGGEIGLFLDGTLRLKVEGQPLVFGLTLLVVENGVLISGSVVGTIDFGVLKLSNLALVVGIDFEAIPSFGVAAQLDVPAANFDSSCAVFFDSTDPAKSLLAGSVSNINLLDIVEHLAGTSSVPTDLQDVLGSIALKGLSAFSIPASLSTALDNLQLGPIASAFSSSGNVSIPNQSGQVLLVVIQKGQSWSLTDLSKMNHYLLEKQTDTIAVSLEAQLYVAPAQTQIGQLTFEQGFHVDAEIDFLLVRAQIRVNVNANHGIAADVAIDPIILLNKNFFVLTGDGGQSGPLFSLATFSQPQQPQGLQGPHLLLSGQLQLLGLISNGLLVNISKDGFQFQLTETPVPGVQFSLHADFNSLTNMDGGGSATVGLNTNLNLGPFGTIDLDTSVDGSIDLSLKGTRGQASFAGSFDFQGNSFSIATFQLDVNADPFKGHNLQNLLFDKVRALLEDFLKDADRWLKWVKNRVFTGAQKTAQEVGQFLRTHYKLLADDIAKKTKQILDYTAQQASQALRAAGFGLNAAAQALRQAGYVASDVGQALKNVYQASIDQVAQAMKAADYTVVQIGTALRNAFTDSANQAAQALRSAGFTAEQVGDALKGTFTNSAQVVGEALKSAGFGAEEAANVLKNVFGADANTVADVLKNTFGVAGQDALRGILSGVGFTASQVGNILGKLFPHIKIGHVKLPHVKIGHVKISL